MLVPEATNRQVPCMYLPGFRINGTSVALGLLGGVMGTPQLIFVVENPSVLWFVLLYLE